MTDEQADWQPDPEAKQEAAPEAEAPESPGGSEAEAPEPEADDAAALRREAAGYRRKLRESEAEARRLADRLDEVQRTAVEDQLTGPGKLADGSDIWLAGIELSELRDDDGALDREKVEAALSRTIADHPAWQDRTPVSDYGGGARSGRPVARPSFGEALKNPERRR
jgi:hypothetical protein